MKTKLITNGKVDILLVDDLPEDVLKARFTHYTLEVKFEDDEIWTPLTFSHSNGKDWQFLSTIEDLTEYGLSILVGREFNNYRVQQKLNQQPQYDMFWVRYPNGNSKQFNTKQECYIHALKMELHLLLKYNGVLFENRIEKPNTRHFSPRELENDNSRYWKLFEKWEAAQQKVFNSKTTLIFIKND